MKPWYQSKTVLVNALILLLAVADAAQALPVPATWAPYIIAAASVLNVALRLTTSTGLTRGVPLGEDPAMRAQRSGGSAENAPASDPSDRAPSLVDEIARDNGMAPPDVTPEDTV